MVIFGRMRKDFGAKMSQKLVKSEVKISRFGFWKHFWSSAHQK